MSNGTTDYTGLIQNLDEKLTGFKYGSDVEISIPNIQYITYIKNPGVFKVKNLCAVINMPANIVDVSTAKKFFKFLKESLLGQYGDAFLWKELEMCFVVLCEKKLYEILKNSEERVMNQASFSLNAMLGTCFINKENLDNFAESTWGVYFSGAHFKAISETVVNWCENQKTGQEG